jgi:hypothetical protein
VNQLQSPQRELIEGAMQEWQAKTAIRFVARTNQTNYVVFQTGQGCASPLGVEGGAQPLYLGPQCGATAAVHELGHTVGLIHEHQRPDRDQYVTVNLQNAVQGSQTQFAVVQGAITLTQYDIGSNMHYPSTAFSTNGQPTLVPRQQGVTMGSPTLSAQDVAAVAALYNQGGTGGGTGNGGGTQPPVTPPPGGGNNGTGGNNNGTGGTCQEPCVNYGMAEGQCGYFATGAWMCQGGCMQQVATCGTGGTNNGTGGTNNGTGGTNNGTGGTNNGTGGTCQDPCVKWGMAEGQCGDFATGSFLCQGGCLQQVATCGGYGNGGAGNGGNGTGGNNNGTGGTCQAPCASYGMAEGQCAQFSNGSFACYGGCLQQVQSCGAGGNTGGGAGGACQNPCASWGMGEGQCAQFADGAWACYSGCLEPVEACF